MFKIFCYDFRLFRALICAETQFKMKKKINQLNLLEKKWKL